MGTTSTKTKDLIKEFAKPSVNKDFNAINEILDKNGEFEIQDLELVDTTKTEFRSWYENKLKEVTVTDIIYDQCISCSFGHQIVLFNEGYIPRVEKDSSEQSKIAFMVDLNDDEITKISFCLVFLKTENKYIFECMGKIINDDVKSGSTFEEALENFDKNSAYDHFKFESENEDLQYVAN